MASKLSAIYGLIPNWISLGRLHYIPIRKPKGT